MFVLESPVERTIDPDDGAADDLILIEPELVVPTPELITIAPEIALSDDVIEIAPLSVLPVAVEIETTPLAAPVDFPDANIKSPPAAFD